MCRELRSADELRAGKAYKKGKRDWISTPFVQGIKKCGSGKSWKCVLKRTKKEKEIDLVKYGINITNVIDTRGQLYYILKVFWI